MPYIYLDISSDNERRDSRRNPKRIDGYIHLDSLSSAANPEPRSRINSTSLGYIYFDADSKPCGEGWIAKQLTCRIGMAAQSAKQKVKELFKPKAQKEAEAKARAIENLRQQGEDVAKTQRKIVRTGKGHDLIDLKPIQKFSNVAGGAYAEWEYKAHGLAEMMGMDIEKARATVKSLADYTGQQYSTIREVESGKDSNPKRIERFQKDIDNLNEYMEKAPKFEGDISRGLSFESGEERQAFLDSLTKSGSMSLNAMSSWTSNAGVSLEFAESERDIYGDDTGVILRARNKSGVSVKNFSTVPGEDEVLAPKGTKYRVKGQSKDDRGNVIIDLEEY